MDDKHPEAITVELGGKERRLKLGPAAFRLAAMRHGVTITTEELSAPTLAMFAQLAWVGMLPDDPDLKEDEVILALAAHDNEGEVLGYVKDALERMTDGLERAFSGNGRKGRGRK